MLSYLEFLMDWAVSWNAAGRVPPSVHAVLGDPDLDKRAAWLVVEGEGVAGQLTVWESGECELEAYRVDDSAAVLLEHRELSSLDDLEASCRAIIAVCGGTAE